MTYDVSIGQGDSDFLYVQIKAGGTAVNLSSATSLKCMMENDPGTVQHEITCTAGANIPITTLNYALLGQTVSAVGTTVSFSAANGWLTVPITDTETAAYGVFFGNFIIILSGDQHTAPSDENDIIINIKKRRFVEAV
jgi:hypothetical protein